MKTSNVSLLKFFCAVVLLWQHFLPPFPTCSGNTRADSVYSQQGTIKEHHEYVAQISYIGLLVCGDKTNHPEQT